MPVSPQYRAREIARFTCIRAFTGRENIKSGVFDATTLSPVTTTPPAPYATIYNASGVPVYNVAIGTFLTFSTSDPTKVKAFQGLGANANDVQTVTITGTPTGGTFTLSYNGQVTGNIAFNATAATVAAALVALPGIGASANVAVTGGPGPGTPWVVTFQGLLGNLPQNVLVANGAGLTGGASPAISVTHTTPGTTAEAIMGVFDGPDKDFFGNASVGYDEVIPIYHHAVSFDISKLQNWAAFGAAAKTALNTCSFY